MSTDEMPVRTAQAIYRTWLRGLILAGAQVDQAKRVIEQEATLRNISFDKVANLPTKETYLLLDIELT
jgi:hypothetical protein